MSTRSSLQTQAGKFIISGAISAVVDLGLTWVLRLFFGAGPVLAPATSTRLPGPEATPFIRRARGATPMHMALTRGLSP